MRCWAVVVVVVAGALSGCAQVAAECAGYMLQATAQVCVDVLCDDNSIDDDVSDDNIPPPRPREEPPAPSWQPHDGRCDVVTGDDGHVRVACPDGTRAEFSSAGGGVAAHVLVEEWVAQTGEDDCRDGRILREGIDADGDGALGPTEITGRIVACPDDTNSDDDRAYRAATLVGHLAILGPEDVARLSGRRALTGGLAVKTSTLVKLELPQLQSLGGTFRVDGATALESLALPSLAAVGGDVVLARSPRLSKVGVPALVKVGGGVVVVDNPALAQSDAEGIVFRLSRHGYAGSVDLAGNGVR